MWYGGFKGIRVTMIQPTLTALVGKRTQCPYVRDLCMELTMLGELFPNWVRPQLNSRINGQMHRIQGPKDIQLTLKSTSI